MSKLEKYSSYKDSGVEWIGQIPEHWEAEKGKWLFREEKRPVRPDDKIITCFRDGEVTLRSNRRSDGFTNALKEHGYQGIRKGDLVIHNMDAFAGAVGISDSNGKSTPVYSACTPLLAKEVEPKFYALYLQSLAKQGFIESLAKGIRERSSDFRFNDFKELLLAFPPKDEQTKIVNFLNKKTAQIDEAIKQKEELISLLKERRQVLIHKAVTQGLDSTVKMKNSGVAWIGDIPEHWNLLPGFKVYKENKSKNTGMIENTVLSLSYGNIVIKPEEKLVGLVPESFETYQIVNPGDIIVRCMDLQNDKTSLRTGIARDRGIITSAYLNLNVFNNVIPEYLHHYLHMLDTTKVLYKFGTGLRQNLSYFDFKRLPIVFPKKEEQQNILEYIKISTTRIDTLIKLQEEYIHQLKEYKGTFIDSCVTGKVKVL